jgi:hypothetical protein
LFPIAEDDKVLIELSTELIGKPLLAAGPDAHLVGNTIVDTLQSTSSHF